MYDLTIINKDGGNYIDSREVAKAIDKAHRNLLRDIRGYIEIMGKAGQLNFEQSSFFLESSYINSQSKQMPCYLLSKMGCELVANKLTGEKGVLFTAAYVAKFNEMEAKEKERLESNYYNLLKDYAELAGEVNALSALPTPRLGEINACARLTVRTMRNAKTTPESILEFLKDLYEPYGISIDTSDMSATQSPMYTATQIAEMLGVYSINGNPHNQAISCILNENILISSEHKSIETEDFGTHINTYTKYDEYAVQAVTDWLDAYGYPNEIYGFERTFRVIYEINPLSSRNYIG